MLRFHELATEQVAARERRSCPTGFTLLEVVAALVLTALLATAAFAVLRPLLQESSRGKLEFPTAQLREQLQRDLANATSYQFSDNRLILFGDLAIEREAKFPLFVPAEIEYSCSASSIGWLLRRQQTLAARNGIKGEVSSDPLWVGVKSIIFTSTYLDDEDAKGSAAGWKQLPPAYRLRLFDDKGRLLISESIEGSGL